MAAFTTGAAVLQSLGEVPVVEVQDGQALVQQGASGIVAQRGVKAGTKSIQQAPCHVVGCRTRTGPFTRDRTPVNPVKLLCRTAGSVSIVRIGYGTGSVRNYGDGSPKPWLRWLSFLERFLG